MKALLGLIMVFFTFGSLWSQTPRDQNPFDGAKRVKKEPEGFREWADASKKFKIKARFAGTADDKVKLLKEDGSVLKISPEKLSNEDQRWINDKQSGTKSKLDAKRKEHTSWTTKAVGVKPVLIDDPTSFITAGGYDRSGNYHGASGGVQHNYYQSTQKHYYMQPFSGQIRSYVKNDVVISVSQGDRSGRQQGAKEMTFKYNNLGKADQQFLDEYRKLEKELDGSP